MSQAQTVADRVLALREEGIGLGEQAVLFRTGHHSDLLELELGRRDIPFVKFGGLKFLEAAHVKDLVALLRILDNPYDELAWHRVLRALPGVGPAVAGRVLDALGVGEPAGVVQPDGGTRDPLCRFLSDPPALPAAARADAGELAAALSDCNAPTLTPAAQVERLSRWLVTTFERRYERAEVRAGDLRQLQVTAAAYESRSRFLAELVLEPPASTGDHAGEPHLDDEFLTLSTIHSAKGGEWQAVHLIHAADGNLPSDMALSSQEGLEEERRLLYVALTRARDVLAVYNPLRYHHKRQGFGDRHSYAPLSRFLEPLRHRFVAEHEAVTGPDGAAVLDVTAKVTIADEVDLSVQRLWSV